MKPVLFLSLLAVLAVIAVKMLNMSVADFEGAVTDPWEIEGD
jgi:hypothetical protein